jgi:hypothetical protein
MQLVDNIYRLFLPIFLIFLLTILGLDFVTTVVTACALIADLLNANLTTKVATV